jgi:hypothetical protein
LIGTSFDDSFFIYNLSSVQGLGGDDWMNFVYLFGKRIIIYKLASIDGGEGNNTLDLTAMLNCSSINLSLIKNVLFYKGQ